MSNAETNKSLFQLSDDALLRRLSEVLSRSRRVESELVAHIAEVDARRLYAREGSPSMFQYCVDVLHLSKAEAYHRIAAARASRKHPVLLEMLEEGSLHLSGIAVLAPHLDALAGVECERLLARAAHRTKDAIKELVAEIAPKPDVPSVVRKLPTRRTPASDPAVASPQAHSPTSTPPARNELRLDGVATPTTPAKSAVVAVLSPARYKVQFTASAELRDKLRRLESLLPGNDLASVIDAAVTEKIERLEAKRFGKTNKPRKTVEDADTSPGERRIPAPVKRFVYERDGWRCTFVSAEGRRCGAREQLELHHDEPYSLGGDRSPGNIRLLCREHNAYMAELDFGKEKMNRYRRSADRVGEPSPSFETPSRRSLHTKGLSELQMHTKCVRPQNIVLLLAARSGTT